MSGYNTSNYTEQGGSKTVIGGELVIEGRLTIANGAVCAGLPAAENQTASTATTIAALKDDFNTLIAALKAAGLMDADKSAVTEG